MPDSTNGAWDLIAVPWHLDEHIPDFPVPAGAAATVAPALPDGAVPSRMNVLHRAAADAVAGLRFPSGPGPALGDVENCLNAITASADVVAASLACAWLPGQVGRPPARAAITRLASALGQAMRPA
jgi:hypothetical protein